MCGGIEWWEVVSVAQALAEAVNVLLPGGGSRLRDAVVDDQVAALGP